jgi:hypothetical protein
VSPTVSNGRVKPVNPARPDHCGGTAVHLVCDVLVLGGFLVVFLGAAALMVRRHGFRRSADCTRESKPDPAWRLTASAKGPPAGSLFQQIGGAGNALGGFGHLGGHLAGSSGVFRSENHAQVRDQRFRRSG